MTETNNPNATDDQNVIMEESQDATPTSEAAPIRRTSSATLLLFAIAGLMFAGGYAYANQGDFLAALGLQSEMSKYAGQGCCSTESTVAASSESECPSECSMASAKSEGCPLEAAMAKGETPSQCCQGMKTGLANSLLKKPETDEVASAFPPAPAMPEEL